MYTTLSALSAILIPVAHANLSQAASDVANGLPALGGLVSIATAIRVGVLGVIASIALFVVIRAGLKLINSQDEGKLEEAKRSIASSLVAVMLAFLSDRLVDAFYNPGGDIVAGASILRLEVLGIVRWANVIVFTTGVAIIIASALKVVASFGKEDGTAELRRTVTGVIFGVLMIMLTPVINATLGLDEAGGLGTPSASPIIERVTGIVGTMFGLVAVIATGMIVYSGILMIFNFANEEQFAKGKGLMLRALVGLVVMVGAYALATAGMALLS